MTADIIPFPPRLRVVPASVHSPLLEQAEPGLVNHDGRTYRAADLMAWLSLAEIAEVLAAAPRSGQAAWDEFVRRWPCEAELIALGCSSLPGY